MQLKRKYLIGISWFILSLIISNLNDVVAKFLGQANSFQTVAFYRFLFGVLSLLPFMFYCGVKEFKTSRPLVHFLRGAILYISISLWIYGLNHVPIATATLTTFTIPLFLLILAPVFLKERISLPLKLATILGFLGVVIVYRPHTESFEFSGIALLVSAFLFAALDIINKKFVSKESMLSMLFYSGLVTTVLSAPAAVWNYQQPSGSDMLLLLLLGIGSNLILYFLLKAFSLVKASDVAPYRYLELIISAFMGLFFFLEVPSVYFFVGSGVIIISTFYVAVKQGAKAG